MRRDVDAVALRGELVVADRLEREAVARAQQQHDEREDRDRERERDPVDQELAHLPASARSRVTMPAGRLMPEPPPSAETCEASRRKTSATIQVPIAK